MMLNVKEGDILRCLVDRPYAASVYKGDLVKVTRVWEDGDIRFSPLDKDRSYMGDITHGHWEPYHVDLENK